MKEQREVARPWAMQQLRACAWCRLDGPLGEAGNNALYYLLPRQPLTIPYSPPACTAGPAFRFGASGPAALPV